MKKMPKNLFDELIERSRQYWKDGDCYTLADKGVASHKVEDATGVDWLSAGDLVDSIIRWRGFLPNAENEKIYEVLKVLGWEVVDDGEDEHIAG